MGNIQRPDQHLATYIYEKQTNPDAQIVLRQFKRSDVEAVDRLVELAHGERDLIKTENDWKIVEELMKFWATRWPNEYIEFKSAIADIRKSRNDKGYSKSKEIKYVGALPSHRFMKILKSVFPIQQWDKQFTYKFIKRFPLFKVS